MRGNLGIPAHACAGFYTKDLMGEGGPVCIGLDGVFASLQLFLLPWQTDLCLPHRGLFATTGSVCHGKQTLI